MHRDPMRGEETQGPVPGRPWGEMAVVADPDDCDEGIADEDLPDTIPDPRPLPPLADDVDDRGEGLADD